MAIETTSTACGCGPADTSCCTVSTLTEREEALLALGIAMAFNRAETVKEAIIEAKQAGITNDEISLVSEVVSAMQGNCGCSPLEELSVVSAQGGASSCCR